MPEDCQLKPGETVPPIESISTNTGKTDRRKGKKELKKLRHKLADLQHRLYAEGRRKLLVVFQAMDAGGKDGTTRRVFDGVNPQGVQVTSFKNPTSEELRHDFLWRIHRAVPAAGMIGVFNRSHYEDVLVARVDKLVPETVWKARYEHINHFERLLTDSGTRILKFYLHVSREEQLGRLRSRLEDPRKLWKYSADDFTKRRLWPRLHESLSGGFPEMYNRVGALARHTGRPKMVPESAGGGVDRGRPDGDGPTVSRAGRAG